MTYTDVVRVSEQAITSPMPDSQVSDDTMGAKKQFGVFTHSLQARLAYTAFTALTYIVPLGIMFYCIATGWPQHWYQPFILTFCTLSLIGVNMSVCLHRYFSHRAFETTRQFQFVVAVLGCLAFQNGPLWWASKHNRHHKYCDLPEDPHSVTQQGFFYAFVGWTMVIEESYIDESHVAAQFRNKPELQFLNTYWPLPSILLNVFLYYTVGYMWMGNLYTVPMILCRLITLLFNVEYHPKEDPKKCKAVDTPRWMATVVGEADHLDHHKFPMRLQRPGWDMPYYLFVKPCLALGLIWYRK